MSVIFSIVLLSTLYATITGAIILILKSIIGNKMNPKWHYLIWMVLIIKLLIPFGPESALSIFNQIPKVQEIYPSKGITAVYETNHKAYIYKLESADKSTIMSTSPLNKDNLKDSFLNFASKVEIGLPFVWLFGVLFMLVWLLYTYIKINKLIKNYETQIGEDIYTILEECKMKIGMNRKVVLVLQNLISSPSIYGLFRPKILVTKDILKMNKQELSFIFHHELMHLKRGDLFVNCILLLIQAFHWFNPFVWFFFKKIRQDMELATDEKLLSSLASEDRKEYGKALITVAENINNQKLTPKLLGIVDDKQGIANRIRLIKMMDIFKKQKKLSLSLFIFTILLLSAVLLTNAMTKEQNSEGGNIKSYLLTDLNGISTETYAKRLSPLRIKYIGDASKVGRILGNLDWMDLERRDGFSLNTKKAPYGLNLKLYIKNKENDEMNTNKETKDKASKDNVGKDNTNNKIFEKRIADYEYGLMKNAVFMFSLIENADVINFTVIDGNNSKKISFKKSDLQQDYPRSLYKYSESSENMRILIDSIDHPINVSPKRYSMVMSSAFGMRINIPDPLGDKVKYTADIGSFFTSVLGTIDDQGEHKNINSKTKDGKITTENEPKITMYWQPGTVLGVKGLKNYNISIIMYKKGKIYSERVIKIQTTDGLFFTAVNSVDFKYGDREYPSDPKSLVEYFYNNITLEKYDQAKDCLADGIKDKYTNTEDSYFKNIKELSDIKVFEPHDTKLDKNNYKEVLVTVDYRVKYKKIITDNDGYKSRYIYVTKKHQDSPWKITSIGTGP